MLLFGMLSIAVGTLCLALGFRKCGLFFIGVYGLLMSFIGVGLCYIFGPVIILFAAGGLIREWMNAPKKA